MYNSPMPSPETGKRNSSSLWIVVLAIGALRRMRSSDSVTRATIDQIVVSVGPYMFQSEAQHLWSCVARFLVRASPPDSILRPGEPFHPAPSSIVQVVGVSCMTDTDVA